MYVQTHDAILILSIILAALLPCETALVEGIPTAAWKVCRVQESLLFEHLEAFRPPLQYILSEDNASTACSPLPMARCSLRPPSLLDDCRDLAFKPSALDNLPAYAHLMDEN